MPTDPTTQQPRADGGENAMDDALLAAATGAVTPPQDAPIENAEDAWGGRLQPAREPTGGHAAARRGSAHDAVGREDSRAAHGRSSCTSSPSTP